MNFLEIFIAEKIFAVVCSNEMGSNFERLHYKFGNLSLDNEIWAKWI